MVGSERKCGEREAVLTTRKRGKSSSEFDYFFCFEVLVKSCQRGALRSSLSEMPSHKKRRIPEGELADSNRPASASGRASSSVAFAVGDSTCADTPPALSTSAPSTSSHDLHANLPLFVTGPAIIKATSGSAWCHGWRLQSIQQGDDDDDDDDATLPTTSLPSLSGKRCLDLDYLSVPAGAVARLEAAPLGPGDVPLTARSCRVAITVPKCLAEATTPSVSRAFPQNGAATTSTLPPPPPASWRAAAASIASGAQASVAAGGGPPSVVVIGPKNAGKSSFARLLTNELLSSFSTAAAANDDSTGGKGASAAFSPVVAWCDTDCGQPELTPPGLVSLSHVSRPLLASGGMSGDCARRTGSESSSSGGSGSVHQPARAHFLGALSPASDPDRACAAADSLLTWHWQHGGVESGSGGGKRKRAGTKVWPPLVVNSPGWVRGAGLDLLTASLAAARPTHVVRLSTGNAERDAPPVLELFGGARLPPLLEVVELPALGGGVGGRGGDNAEDGAAEREEDAAAAPPPSLFQGIIQTPTPAGARYSAADARTTSWFSFACSCVESAAADCDEEAEREEEKEEEKETPSSSSSSADLLVFLPAALAAARPMVIPLSSVRLEFLGEKPSSLSDALRVLNGAVVALATAAEAGKGANDDEEGDPSAFSSSAPSPTVSLALVRGVDGRRGLIHLLCPLRSAEALAAGVVALQVGHPGLELPPSLLAGGLVVSARRSNDDNSKTPLLAVSSSPYLAPWCLAAGGTGARATKSRNDLARGGGARS